MIRFSFFLFAVLFVFQLRAAVPQCLVVGSATPHYDRLSKSSKIFWLKVGKKFQEQIEADFKRPQNTAILDAELKRGHPYLQFLKSLGFEISPNGVKTPSFPLMLEKLLGFMDVLNSNLREQNPDIQIHPELHLSLIDPVELKQRVILKPLTDFDGSDFSVEVNQGLLPDLAFVKKVSRGEFPIGGLGNASRASRAIMDSRNAPNIMDFLHDLAHLDVFTRQPEYAVAFVRHYRSLYSRWSRLNEEERAAFAAKYIKQAEMAWLRGFLFTEGSWIARPQLKKHMGQWPIISKLVSRSDVMTENSIHESLKSVDQEALRRELQELMKSWWKLFEPLGGATNDMISVKTFTSKSQMPLVGALEALENILKRPDLDLRPATLALLFGILKYSPEMTISKWEHFVRTPDNENGAMMILFRKMFPERVLQSNSSEWSAMGRLLYKNFGQL